MSEGVYATVLESRYSELKRAAPQSFPDTFAQWQLSLERAISSMEAGNPQNTHTIKTIDPQKFIAWCKELKDDPSPSALRRYAWFLAQRNGD